MKKKNWIVVALCIAIVGMGIGFAALAQNLEINATANITADWNLEITDIHQWEHNPSCIGGKLESSTWDGTSTTFAVDLPYPGACVEARITIRNWGNIPARLNSITGITAANSVEPTQIQFSVTNLDTNYGNSQEIRNADFIVNPPNFFINANEGGSSIHIRAEWVVEDGVESVIPDVTNKTATISFNYVQNT